MSTPQQTIMTTPRPSNTKRPPIRTTEQAIQAERRERKRLQNAMNNNPSWRIDPSTLPPSKKKKHIGGTKQKTKHKKSTKKRTFKMRK